ncbi:MAG TPA: hypothetical protein VI566_13450, partial [Xanthomonadales bacterium]|nr:hypothetical protein [Xanthomonadales bacterium]
ILAVRDIKVRYKQSLVGVGWVVVQPHCSRHSSRSEPLKDSMNAFVALSKSSRSGILPCVHGRVGEIFPIGNYFLCARQH